VSPRTASKTGPRTGSSTGPRRRRQPAGALAADGDTVEVAIEATAEAVGAWSTLEVGVVLGVMPGVVLGVDVESAGGGLREAPLQVDRMRRRQTGPRAGTGSSMYRGSGPSASPAL
jgi:hypothetical protein